MSNIPAFSDTEKPAHSGRGSRTFCIAMVAPSLDILGGQGIQARSLAQALRSEGIDVLFIPVNPRFPRGLGWLRRIPVVRTLINELFYIAGLWRLRHADAVHVFSASYWSFLLAPVPAILVSRLFGKRIILNYHSGEAGDHLARWGMRVHPWLSMVDEIAVPSEYLKKEFARYGYRARVLRNIIDTSCFHYRERLQLRPHILSNRNLEVHYGVDNTLKAFAILRKQRPDARLTIAGYGTQQVRLRQWVKSIQLDGVEFLGRIDPQKMPLLYDEADIFINSSLIDNQPISILEAFAAGLPVLTTPTGDIPSMVQHGKFGTLVAQNDPEAMAKAIVALLESQGRAADMARQARKEVEKYTWRRVCRDWTELYFKEKGETAAHS